MIKEKNYKFVQFPSAIMEDSRITNASVKLLAISMYNHADNDTMEIKNTPRSQFKAEALISTDSTYYKAIHELEKLGYIVETKQMVGSKGEKMNTKYTLADKNCCEVEYTPVKGCYTYDRYNYLLNQIGFDKDALEVLDIQIWSLKKDSCHTEDDLVYQVDGGEIRYLKSNKLYKKTSNDTAQDKVEDTPADKPVENAPVETSNEVPEVKSSPARKSKFRVAKKTSNENSAQKKYYFDYLIYSTQQTTRRFVDIQRDEYGNSFVYLADFPTEIRKNLRDKQANRSYGCPDYAAVTNKIWKDFEGRVY